MIEHSAEKYECVQKTDVLKGYLEHFREVSINNEIPGLLSFFFMQGQCALPYVRIPIGKSNIDPRVSVFWIQDTRTGKSVAYEIIQNTMSQAGLECVDYSTGTDAALVGSFRQEDADSPPTVREGVLAGRKGMNFDEGSILLKPSKHSENTVLFLQSALNAAGTGRNVLTKHLADGTITIESLVSLWITTFPPDGIKEYVLDKGIFQRVLLYWRDWTLDMKKDVAYQLADNVHSTPKFTMKYDDIVQYFVDLDKRLKKRVCDINDISPIEWDTANGENDDDNAVCQQREEWTMNAMKKMFTISADYRPALKSAIDEYYSLIEDMDPKKQGVCASFIMGLQNYTNIIAHHMAMLEGTWVVTGIHVDMAKEILYDLYLNLIHWLESKVKVGTSAAETKKEEKAWREAFKRCEVFDFDDHRGRGWVKKKALYEIFGSIQNLSSETSIRERFKRSEHMFDASRDGNRQYVRIKPSAREE